jgi:ABC-type sugar transport system permease subunit
MIRMIDAVKSFDIIFAITQGGPGSASETINLYLYSVAFVYYDVGYASAIVVVFFALIVALAAALLRLRTTAKSCWASRRRPAIGFRLAIWAPSKATARNWPH